MKRLALHAVVLLTLSACTESTRPAAPPSPQGDVALSVTAACPTPANVVVHDEAGLLTALDAAYPGEVIGLDGFFGITAGVTIATPGVTLTCATPGSGLFAIAGSGVQDMLIASASHVVVDRLVLDGTQAGDSPRSEEHTSELQSRVDLVCRLLLEKKNERNQTIILVATL